MATSAPERVEQDHPQTHHRRPVDRVVFGTAAGLALAFLLYGAIDPSGFNDGTNSGLSSAGSSS